ncbi:MAG: hypothetical protein U9Q81_12460 [Pseudomonadota bacterium]|nr:hypothetical protein [Pseudomonadota bacterium]
MTFRITRTVGENGTLLRVDGRLNRDGLGELERASETAIKPLTIDLAGLRFADDAALAALRRLEKAGARLIGASQYLELRLKSFSQGA